MRPTPVEEILQDEPHKQFVLKQNHPNPFSATTVISYSLPVADFVKLEIYNLSGQRIRTLVSENQSTGIHHVNWNGRNDFGEEVPSGIYLCIVTAGNFKATKKMIILK